MSNAIHPIADFHTHTVFSPHAYSTVTENARAAASCGMLAIACTDHGTETPDSGHYWHFANLSVLPPVIEGVRVLQGMEANVMDATGRIDMSSGMRQKMDIVIASMHDSSMADGSVDEISAAWSVVAADPDIDIIGHCGTPRFAFDYEQVIPLFGQYGKVVEINEGSFRIRKDSYENCKKIASLCKKYGVRIAVDSDAHFHTHVGHFDAAIALLEEVAFPPELIVNNSREQLEAFLQEKGLSL